MYDVFINGCGTVGRPLAKKLNDLGFRNVAVSVKSAGVQPWQVNEKLKLKQLLDSTGYSLYVVELNGFEKYGLKPLGTVDELFRSGEQFGVVIDGTPNARTAKLQKELYYDSAEAKGVLFSGGSEFGVAPNWLGVPGTISDHEFDHFMSVKYCRNVSCNATFLGTMFALLSRVIDWGDVEFVNTNLFRRQRDPHEKHKPLGIGVKAPVIKGLTKYVKDVQTLIPGMSGVEFSALPYSIPSEIAHYVQTMITFKTPISEVDVEQFVQPFHDYPLSITVDSNKKLDTDDYNEKLAMVGIVNGEITSPIYRVSKLSSKQLLIDGFTPQQLIDGPSKLVYILGKLGMITSVSEGVKLVSEKVEEGGLPLVEFNEKLEELLNK